MRGQVVGMPETDARVTVQGVVLLRGIVGSTAYGLAGPDSDVDRLGIFAALTESLLGLTRPAESLVTTGPDITLHELGKWCRLALKCNPTVTELVWLPDDLYEVRTPLGDQLIDMRTAFLSRMLVRNAYLGYATQQFRKLESRGDGSFSADTRKRTAKHARHLRRLLEQGTTLHQTGELVVRLTPEQLLTCVDFGERVADGNVEVARDALDLAEDVFRRARSPLPESPNTERVDAWLRRTRRWLLPDLDDDVV